MEKRTQLRKSNADNRKTEMLSTTNRNNNALGRSSHTKIVSNKGYQRTLFPPVASIPTKNSRAVATLRLSPTKPDPRRNSRSGHTKGNQARKVALPAIHYNSSTSSSSSSTVTEDSSSDSSSDESSSEDTDDSVDESGSSNLSTDAASTEGGDDNTVTNSECSNDSQSVSLSTSDDNSTVTSQDGCHDDQGDDTCDSDNSGTSGVDSDSTCSAGETCTINDEDMSIFGGSDCPSLCSMDPRVPAGTANIHIDVRGSLQEEGTSRRLSAISDISLVDWQEHEDNITEYRISMANREDMHQKWLIRLQKKRDTIMQRMLALLQSRRRRLNEDAMSN